jgi:hypothetical protein
MHALVAETRGKGNGQSRCEIGLLGLLPRDFRLVGDSHLTRRSPCKPTMSFYERTASQHIRGRDERLLQGAPSGSAT